MAIEGLTFELDSDSVEALTEETLARMPAAQDGFTGPNDEGSSNANATTAAANDTPAATPAAVTAGEFDSSGVAWDENLHAKGRDGKGVKTANGEWRKKRRSRVAGQTAGRSNSANQSQSGAGNPVPALTEAQKTQAMQCGVVVAECIFQTAQVVGGAEWAPRVEKREGVTVNERENMSGAWGSYFIAKGITDMPPSLILMVALGGYMIPRFTNRKDFPETQTRMQRAKEWLAVRWLRFKAKRAAAKGQGAATADLDIEKNVNGAQ